MPEIERPAQEVNGSDAGSATTLRHCRMTVRTADWATEVMQKPQDNLGVPKWGMGGINL